MRAETTLRVALTLSILSVFALSVVLVPAPWMSKASAVAGADASSGTLTKISSGLVSEDSLTNGGRSGCGSGANSTGNINTGYWFIFGDAKKGGATWTACEDSSGLWLGARLGAQLIDPNGFAGIYAESPDGYAMLYHADLTIPAKTIQGVGTKSFNTGLYVQTYDGFLNYVACYGQVNPNGGHYWAAEEVTGSKQQATSYEGLFQGPLFTTSGPSTEDCTIVTNGTNLLQVYMNGTLEYSSTNAGLNMPEPFNAYLEVESANANAMLFGQYKDYYDTLSNAVSIQNVPAGDTAEVLSGPTVMASSTNSGSAPATLALNVAQYDLPISGTLEVSSGSTVVAATSGSAFWGGDSYSFSTSNAPTGGRSSPLTVDSENTDGDAITGYRTELFNSGGGLVQAGFTPQVYVLGDGSGYQVEADSYGPCTFAHWSGAGVAGSTDNPVPVAIAGPTTLTAVYSGSGCGPQTTTRTTTTATSAGRPSVTVESVDEDGQPITGYYNVLRTSAGGAIASGYTERTYTAVTAGEGYEIQLDNYGGCTFNHWQATGSTMDPLPFTQADGPMTFVGVFDCTS